MTILHPTTSSTQSQHTRRHNTVDLVSGARDTHDYEFELGQAVESGDKNKVIEIAKQWAEHTADKTDSLLSVEEIAMKLNLCTRSVWRLVAKGELPEPIRVGHSRRWYPADLKAYLEKQTAKRKPTFQSQRSLAA